MAVGGTARKVKGSLWFGKEVMEFRI